jgi:DNA repair exonuclease SbcCD ATPase subunit
MSAEVMEATAAMELAVVVKGEVVSSNLPEFREAVAMFISGINRDLKTDAEFGQAEGDVKRLRAVEDGIKTTKARALAQAESLNALLSELDESDAEVRKTRLELENQIKRQKEAVRSQLVADALNAIQCAPHLRLKTFGSVVEGSIKGKKSLDSIKKSLREISGSINELIANCKAVIEEWETSTGEICPDKETLMLGNPDNVRLVLAQRTQARMAAEEKKRLEEAAQAEREARMKAEAEAKAAPAPNVTTPTLVALPAPTPASPTVELTEAEEMAAFQRTLQNAFAPIKAAREGLNHSNNIQRAKAFALALNDAWKLLKGGGA